MEESRIVYPSSKLCEYVKYYWILKKSNSGCINLQTIPSGCLHLVFHRGGSINMPDGSQQPKNFIRGQFSTSGILVPQGDMDMIAVLFYPLGMLPFFNTIITDISNRYVDVDDLEDDGLSNLKRAIDNEEDSDRCISLIESFLISRFSDNHDYIYKRMLPSLNIIIRGGDNSVENLSSQSCYSYRQYKRVFSSLVGVNPKTYSRIIRFQRALYLLQLNNGISLSELAFQCGYYDVPHLVKEFKLMSGTTPLQYLATHKAYSTFFANGSELNIIKGE